MKYLKQIISLVFLAVVSTMEAQIVVEAGNAESLLEAITNSQAAAATINEALKCKETGEAKTILFNLSGHGFVDMGAYDSYFSGEMQNYHVSEEDLARFIKSADELNK